MTKNPPFSKLKKTIEGLFDEQLQMEFCCNSYPIRGQWGHNNSIPRFYLKMENEVIWDFPADFEIKELHFGLWADNNNISALVREYIDTPVAELMQKEFENEKLVIHDDSLEKKYEINYHLTELFIAADKRLGREKLILWARRCDNLKVLEILIRRYNLKAKKTPGLIGLWEMGIVGKVILANQPPTTYEEMKAQIERINKRGEIQFAKEAPEIQKGLKKIQTPLSFSDTRHIYLWLWRNQISLEMLSKEVLDEFKKTEQYERFLKEMNRRLGK